MNNFVAEDEKTIVWIKQLSKLFDMTNIEVARQLHTSAGNKRYLLQQSLRANNKTLPIDYDTIVVPYFDDLKKRGADLNFSYEKYYPTILLEYIRSQDAYHTNITKYWIQNGDINICTPNGTNAVMIALSRGHYLTDLLLDHPQFKTNHQDAKGYNHFYYCFEGFDTHGRGLKRICDKAKKLLEKGENPTLANKNGITPLMLAQRRGHRELITLMEEAVKEWNANH